MENSVIIGIAGGSGSGKTTITKRITERFPNEVSVIYHDDYIIKLTTTCRLSSESC